MQHPLPRLILLALSTLAIPVQAEIASESETLQMLYGNEQMVSIATGSQQLLYKAPAVASVITRRDIRQSAATTLNELLDMVPGLHVSRDYYGGDAVYTMRGFFRAPDAGMLIMLNGTPINTLQNGSRFPAFQLPLHNIDQIEIIRGPGSAVYGADAFVGVINIITRRDDTQDETGLGYGSFSRRSAWLQQSFTPGSWKGRVSLQYQGSDGDDGRVLQRDLQSFFDDITGTSASQAPAAMNTAYDTFSLELGLARRHWQLDQWLWMNNNQGNGHGVPGLDVIDLAGQTDSRASLTSIDYANDHIATNWSLKLSLSYLDTLTRRDQQLLPPGSIAPVGNDGNLFTSGIHNVTFPQGMADAVDSHEQQARTELVTLYRGWNSHQLRLSAGYQWHNYSQDEARNYGPGVLDSGQTSASTSLTDITSPGDQSLPDGERHIRYVSVQDVWDFLPDWSLTAGVRHDHYSDFGDTTNPRLALVWQTSYDLSTKLLYGRAFRAPVYRELKLQNQLGFNGNERLRPETIQTLELAWDYRPADRLRYTLGLYGYRAEDLIFAVEDTTIANTFRYENSGTQEGHGMELELAWQMNPDLQLSGNFAWQYSRLVEKDIESPYAPERQLYLKLAWTPGDYWTITPELHYLGKRPRDLGDPRDPAQDYTRLDLSLNYRNHYRNWDLSLRARNLLDADIVEPSIGNNSISGGAALANDIPMEGRSLMLEFRYFPGQ